MGAKRVNKDIINERLVGRGIKLVGTFITVETRSEFMCGNNHTWTAVPNNILSGRGCPECNSSKIGIGNNTKLTKDTVNARINHRKIVMMSDYNGANNIGTFRCEYDHQWTTTVDSVMRGKSNCPHCDGQAKLSTDEINKRILADGRNDLIMVGEYTKRSTPSLFKCINGHEVTLRPASVLAGEGCHDCYSRGFKTTVPVYIYIIDFGNFIKYGVTNNLKKRLASHTKINGEHKLIISKLFENGRDGLEWENSIKKIFGGRYVTKEVCPNGYTETLHPNKLNLLIDTIER